MRPPQNAGESRVLRTHLRRSTLASMRPPQNAGESLLRLRPARELPADASMRPPQNAGESGLDPYYVVRADTRFNEAPAERGGK